MLSRPWSGQVSDSLTTLPREAAEGGGFLPEEEAGALHHGLAEPDAAGREARRRNGPDGEARPIGGRRKRLADVVIAAAALVAAAPLFVLIIILIKVTSPGPAIFAHTRVGFEGRPFRCYKFRTMIADAEAFLAEYLAGDSAAARQWRECQKLSNDPRVTPIGHLLRKSSLDELPQLFNILKGDMSFVGPRPIVSEELVHYGPHVEEYFRARPGLTGLWQVTGRSTTDYARRVSLDVQYIRTWSIWTDLIILCRTTVAVLRFNEAC